jgi:fibronectin type 3 domain-containing protein
MKVSPWHWAVFLLVALCGCRAGQNDNAGSSTPPVDPLPFQHHVDLSWTASASPEVVTYNVYRSPTPNGPYSPLASSITGLAYSDSSVQTGTTYYYVVTAVDGRGRESSHSEAAGAGVP